MLHEGTIARATNVTTKRCRRPYYSVWRHIRVTWLITPEEVRKADGQRHRFFVSVHTVPQSRFWPTAIKKRSRQIPAEAPSLAHTHEMSAYSMQDGYMPQKKDTVHRNIRKLRIYLSREQNTCQSANTYPTSLQKKHAGQVCRLCFLHYICGAITHKS